MTRRESDSGAGPTGKWPQRFRGFLCSYHTRHHLFVAMGHRVRLSRKTRMIWGLIIFFVAFSVRALVAVDFGPVTQTSAQPGGAMSMAFHYEAVRIVRGHGVLLREDWDPDDTSLLIHAPGYAIYLAAIYSSLGQDYFTVQFVQNALISLAAVLVFTQRVISVA